MKSNRNRSAAAGVLCAGLISSFSALAGGTLSYGQPGTAAKAEAQPAQVLEIGDTAVRMSQRGQAQWMLYQDGEKTLYIVDDTKRSYSKVTKQMADQLAAQISGMKAQVEAQLANLPPQQREMMKGMMPKLPDFNLDHTYRIEKSGDARKVGVYNCQPITVFDNDKATEELCLAKIKDVGLKQADMDLLKRMGEALSRMAANFGAGSMAAVLDKIDGVPVEHRKAGDKVAQAVLIKADASTPAANRFTLPEGYSEQALFPGMPQ